MNLFIISKKYLLDLFFPKFCLGCRQEGDWLCRKCKQQIILIRTQVCPKCAKISPKGKFCPKCRSKKFLKGVISTFYFKEGPIQEMIHNFKYNHILEMADFFGSAMAKVLRENLNFSREAVVSAVPLHWLKKKSRGYNQSEILAQKIAIKLKLTYQELLTKTKVLPRQVDLKSDARQKNLKGAFKSVTRNLSGKTIILVDDVFTTGATLQECARALKEAGAKEVWGLVVARG